MTERLKQIGRAISIGSASALDLTGITAQRNNNRIYQSERAKSVQDGLRQDWQNVGKDIGKAISEYGKKYSA